MAKSYDRPPDENNITELARVTEHHGDERTARAKKEG
jgi:hypothetical protein